MRVKYLGDSDPLALINGKVYEALAVEEGYYRVIDETGDDYLYDTDLFTIVESNALTALGLLSDELIEFIERETGFDKTAIQKMNDDEFSDLYDTIADIEIYATLEELDDPPERLEKASDFITIVGNALYRPDDEQE